MGVSMRAPSVEVTTGPSALTLARLRRGRAAGVEPVIPLFYPPVQYALRRHIGRTAQDGM